MAKLSKQDNKLGRKAVRLVQLNLRFCILLSLLLITVMLVVHLTHTLHDQPKRVSLHQYVKHFFDDRHSGTLNNSQNISDEENFPSEEFDLIWSEETIELFQDQLGIVPDILNADDGDAVNSLSCGLGEEFIVSALPGPDNENLSDVVWQYISIIALQSQMAQSDGSKTISMRAFVTEQMRVVLEQLFEG